MLRIRHSAESRLHRGEPGGGHEQVHHPYQRMHPKTLEPYPGATNSLRIGARPRLAWVTLNYEFERAQQFFGRTTVAEPLARDGARGDAAQWRQCALFDRYRSPRCLAPCANFSRRNARRVDRGRRRLGGRAARAPHGVRVSKKRRRTGRDRRTAGILSSGGGAPGARSGPHDRRPPAQPSGNDLDARTSPALFGSCRHHKLDRAASRSPVPALATGGRTRCKAGAVDAPA